MASPDAIFLYLCVGLFVLRPGLGSTGALEASPNNGKALTSIFNFRGAKSSKSFVAAQNGPAPAPGPSSRQSIPVVQTRGCELFNSSQYSQCLTQGCTCSLGGGQNSNHLPIVNATSTGFACCTTDAAGITTCYPPLANGTCSPAAQFPGCCPTFDVSAISCVPASLGAVDPSHFTNGTINPRGGPFGTFGSCDSRRLDYSQACCTITSPNNPSFCAVQNTVFTDPRRFDCSGFGQASGIGFYCCVLPSSLRALSPSGR